MELDQDFRSAMRRLAATVNVITVRANGQPMGMAATSVTSLSMDPPSILVCVNKSASMHDYLLEVPLFCVNILHRDQLDVAQVFSQSSRRAERFVTGRWEHDDEAPPYLSDAQSVLICERTQSTTFATHDICVGTVRKVLLRTDINPLLYVDGRYASLEGLRA